MLNIRIKFQKYGVMRFIGHLDMMRYFQKAIRRAGIDIAYSEGFSPHQIMSFAAPLGVGITSDGEYFDIEVHSSLSSQASIQALNEVMVEGVSVLEYKRLPNTAKTAMSLVTAADYLIYMKKGYTSPCDISQFEKKVHEFYENQSEIVITKHTKKREIKMDLKPLIYEMKVVNLKDIQILHDLNVKNPQLLDLGSESEQPEIPALFLRVCTGSSDNVKPELILEAFCHFHNMSYEALFYQIHRLEVYAKADEIPVKGEKERAKYQKYLEEQEKICQQNGREFPKFLTLGDLGEIIN